MKAFWKNFFLRGSVAAWSGPVVVCIVWACLKAAGVMETMDVDAVVLGMVSSVILAFIAAGISAVHQLEQLPRALAILIHMAVLYLDYLIVYLLNGWIMPDKLWMFTLFFAAGFALIWIVIFLVNRNAVNRMNARIGGKNE